MTKKILIIGAKGMFGSEAAELFSAWGYTIIKADRSDFDITQLDQVRHFISHNPCDFVINAAAYTKVDDAQSNQDVAFAVNGEGAKNIAIATNDKNIPLVFISTDYVFDGEKNAPYLPNDVVNPKSVYGASKLLGEQHVITENPAHYIVRTSWLYGKNGKNFVDTMITLSRTNDVLRVVDDQFGCPTWTCELALGIKNLIDNQSPFGIYHICGSGFTSWYGLAKKIFAISNIGIDVIPVSTQAFPRPAKRPQFSVMDNAGACDDWENALRKYLISK